MIKKQRMLSLTILFMITCLSLGQAQSLVYHHIDDDTIPIESTKVDDEYVIQWEQSYGTSPGFSARYEGPQPIGDCDNDGDNEVLIGGRDARLRIMEWNDEKNTYEEMQTIFCPFYPFRRMDADGFAIGDLTGDGENEIAVSWYATMYKWMNGRYQLIGWNPWIEWNGGGSPDCYIGDCDNDGQNEMIVSCRDWPKTTPEIVVFKWDGVKLVKYAEWDDPEVNGEVFMAGMGDTDDDGENEIVLGSENKVVVLNWDVQTKAFIPTIIKDTPGPGWVNHPFACVCKDSDMDGSIEIHVGYYSPRISIFEWKENSYETKFEKEWPGEGALIESLDVGDVDDDGISEVCAGTNIIHILQWNGETYVEEACINDTFGDLAVLNIGDCDNDGKNEIHVGSVAVDFGEEYMAWIFKYMP